LLKFYDKYEYNFQFLIVDSSSDVLDDELIPYLERDNLSHKKYEPSIFFSDKIADGCQYITTPFAVLCADDDFLIPSGILESRNFLLTNEDYASAHGLYFNHFSAEDAQKKGFSIGPLYQDGSSSEQDSAEKRLNAYLSGATGYYPMYAVHHTDLFQQIWSETKIYVSDWGLSELFPCALSFIYGKMKVLPVFYSSREPNTYTWYDENRLSEMYAKEKVKLAAEGLGKYLCVVDSVDSEKSNAIATRALNLFVDILDKKTENQRNRLVSAWTQLRKNIGLRTRLRKLFLNGCHPSIYPQYLDDYSKLMQSVIDGNLTQDALNSSRKQYNTQMI